MLDNITSMVSSKINEANNEVLKRLAEFAGVNVENINSGNVLSIKNDMLHRGYLIVTHSPTTTTTYHNLMYGESIVLTGKVEWSLSTENGDLVANITYGLESNMVESARL